MKDLLPEANNYTGTHVFLFPPEAIDFRATLSGDFKLGYRENLLEVLNEKCECEKLMKPLHLLNEFKDDDEEILKFLYQKDVPFDNNLAAEGDQG